MRRFFKNTAALYRCIIFFAFKILWFKGSLHTMPDWEIWKRSFISTIRPTIHTNLSRKRSFSKTFFKLGEFENASFSFSFSCGQKKFWKRNFSKTMASRLSCDFFDRVFLNHNSKMTGDILLRFKIPPAQCGRKTCDSFLEWNLRFHIPRHSLDESLRYGKRLHQG